MSAADELLKVIGQAVLESVDAGVMADLAIEANMDLAERIWQVWEKQSTTPGRLQDLEALAAPAADLEPSITRTLSALGQAPTGDIGKSLAAYLRVVPSYVRRRLRRPAQPRGERVPPGFVLESARDLLPLLPPRLPWFGPGDRPWGIGDWELAELLDLHAAGESWRAVNPRNRDVPPVALHFFLHPHARDFLKGPGAGILDQVLLRGNVSGVLPIEQLHVHADPPCVQYAYREAGNLASLVWQWRESKAPFEHAAVAEIILDVARTLAQLHQLRPPLVHRYLRPENIAVWNGPGLKLECRLTHIGLGPWFMGKPTQADLYAEPPWTPVLPPRPNEDVYTLGIIWHQLLTRNLERGRPGGASWRRQLATQGMSQPLIDLLESCWDDEPGQRPADASVLAGEIEKLLRPPQPSVPVAPPAAVEIEPTARPRSRRADIDKLFTTLEQAAPERQKLITNSIGMKLVYVPEGTFMMGSADAEEGRRANEGPVHEVSVTKGFYIAVNPVTQQQFQHVCGRNPSRFGLTNGGSPDHPVESVCHDDAVAFCQRLALAPPEKGRRYRLPTEAEWEYACRAGSSKPFSFGAALGPGQANFDSTFPYGTSETAPPLQKTCAVGSYPSNHFGLCDMHGNVWEWCADWLDPAYYRGSPRRDPQGPPTGQFRVVRGGSWRNHAATCRSAYRNGLPPANRDAQTGFRVVLEAQG